MAITEKNFSSRNRKNQTEFRKRQLIEATIDCIDKTGISQITLARIARQAGLSQGNLIFHFHSKEELLEQTLHSLNNEYCENWQQALTSAADDPVARLRALVKSSFASKICNRKKIGAWFAYWGESRSRPVYMKICGASDKAFSQQLFAQCRDVEAIYGSNLAAETATISIETMIDGLWQYLLIGEENFNRKKAEEKVFELVRSIFPAVSDGLVP
ncbi:MAG: TetR family transcriptional regulator C-terminal domain-containing protein [Pseudomonadota bacterium]